MMLLAANYLIVEFLRNPKLRSLFRDDDDDEDHKTVLRKNYMGIGISVSVLLVAVTGAAIPSMVRKHGARRRR